MNGLLLSINCTNLKNRNMEDIKRKAYIEQMKHEMEQLSDEQFKARFGLSSDGWFHSYKGQYYANNPTDVNTRINNKAKIAANKKESKQWTTEEIKTSIKKQFKK